jgi:hypothetical protein
MESSPLQVTYRAIFTEMLLAQSAAMGAFANVAARCTLLAGQQSQQVLARKPAPKAGVVEPAHPGGVSGIAGASPPSSADVARALAGLPRVSMTVFLSQYDNLRRRRAVVRD